MEFIKALKSRLTSNNFPFRHWEINEPLTREAVKEICDTDVPDPRQDKLNYDGTRAIDGGEGVYREGIRDGGKAKKYRCFIDKENSKQFPHLIKFINELKSPEVHQLIGRLINKDLSKAYIRVEVICDREGFWLKPHCDIKEKLLSSLIFVNPFNESEDLGTDFYDKELKKVKTVHYRDNYGYFFTSGPDTWHGMEKKK